MSPGYFLQVSPEQQSMKCNGHSNFKTGLSEKSELANDELKTFQASVLII